jgi:hypothetical protein
MIMVNRGKHKSIDSDQKPIHLNIHRDTRSSKHRPRL